MGMRTNSSGTNSKEQSGTINTTRAECVSFGVSTEVTVFWDVALLAGCSLLAWFTHRS
jgi:hypothetical protein